MQINNQDKVVVWLKIRKNDIPWPFLHFHLIVVVWLKIRKNDINNDANQQSRQSCGLIKD